MKEICDYLDSLIFAVSNPIEMIQKFPEIALENPDQSTIDIFFSESYSKLSETLIAYADIMIQAKQFGG